MRHFPVEGIAAFLCLPSAADIKEISSGRDDDEL